MRVGQHRVAVLALGPVVGFDLGIPPQIFQTARDTDGNSLYEVQVCSLDGGPVPTTAGFDAQPAHDPGILPAADTVVVPGTYMPGPRDSGSLPAELADALEMVRSGARLVSICTGAFALAAAGLLDGRRATTHWAHADQFRSLYPDVRLDPEVLFVDDGDVLTSAGVAAGVDLCLHLVRTDHGTQVANRAARSCVVPPWREGGQAQFIERPLAEPRDAGTAATRHWALTRLADPPSLAELAAHAGMSVRTFTRRFRDETGVSPNQWLLHQRVEHARHLLEATDLPVDRVAAGAGFGTATALRQHLRSRLGISPGTYRQTFRGAVPSSAAG